MELNPQSETADPVDPVDVDPSGPVGETPSEPIADGDLRQVPLGVGLCLVLVGLAGILDDGGAFPHRWWIPLAAAAMLAGLAVVFSVTARLFGPASE